MGYEIRILVGWEARIPSPEYVRERIPVIKDEGDQQVEVYFPIAKDRRGKDKTTGREGRYFAVSAMIDLKKPGYNSGICKLIQKVHERAKRRKNLYTYFYEGEEEIKEDRYGDPLYPISIDEVLRVLRKDQAEEEYCRFAWAIATLEAVKKDMGSFKHKVVLFGY